MQHKTRAKIWLYSGDKAAWHFVTLSKTIAEKIKVEFKQPRRGWGSIPVVVTMGTSTWKTSVFPDKKTGSFVLPIKAKVRKAQGVSVGQTVAFTLEIDRWK